jgi:predicted NBD/HSP70 family sugar kinase
LDNKFISRLAFGNTLSGVAFKDMNRKKRILSQFGNRSEITITEVSELLFISIPKATELINAMVAEELLVETGKRSEGPGRKATFFALAPGSAYFLGIEIRKYNINLGIMGFDKMMVAQQNDIPFFYQEACESLREISVLVKEFLKNAPVPVEKIAGAGVSISGRVNVHTGQILTIHHFGDAPVKEYLEKELQMPVYLDNDSRTLSYGEFYFGLRTTEQDVLILNLDYGLALGLFVKGKPVYGVSGYAGELGHIPLFDNEKICFCGKKGCLETEASGAAMIEYIVREMNAGSNSTLQAVYAQKGILELEDVLEAINKGDNLALEGVAQIAGKLGRGLAITINLFNPQLIILSGTLAQIGDPLLLPVKTAIIQHSLSLVSNDTSVVLSKLGEQAGLPGCCLLVRDKMFDLL